MYANNTLDNLHSPELDVAQRIYRLSSRPDSWVKTFKVPEKETHAVWASEHQRTYDARGGPRRVELIRSSTTASAESSSSSSESPDSADGILDRSRPESWKSTLKDSRMKTHSSPGREHKDGYSAKAGSRRAEFSRRQTMSSTKSTSAPSQPLNLTDALLDRIHGLPLEMLLRISDEIVREAVSSLYTGCRACRWQDWSNCICRHWQKAFCALASLDSSVGLHVRNTGKALARALSYSPADAIGCYAVGFRFTGSVIGGLRMGDFLFADEQLTALPEPTADGDDFVATRESDSDSEKEKDNVLEVPESKRIPQSYHWMPSKAQKLAGISSETSGGLNSPGLAGGIVVPATTISATLSSALSDCKCVNISTTSFVENCGPEPVSRTRLTGKRSVESLSKPVRSSKRFSFASYKPSALAMFEVVSASANKFKRQSFRSWGSGASLLSRKSRRGSADTNEGSYGPVTVSEKGVAI